MNVELKSRIVIVLRTGDTITMWQTQREANSGDREIAAGARQLWAGNLYYSEPQTHLLLLLYQVIF